MRVGWTGGASGRRWRRLKSFVVGMVGRFPKSGSEGLMNTQAEKAYVDGLSEELERLDRELVRVKHAISDLGAEERELGRRKNLICAELAAAKPKEDSHVAGRKL
jgi:hypothetical protein